MKLSILWVLIQNNFIRIAGFIADAAPADPNGTITLFISGVSTFFINSTKSSTRLNGFRYCVFDNFTLAN